MLMPLAGRIHTDAQGHTALVAWYEQCLQLFDEEVLIDLRALKWIDANQCALLRAMAFDLQRRQRLRFVLDGDIVRSQFPILLRNGFVIGDAEGLPVNTAFTSTTAVQMRSFRPDEDTAFIEYLEQELFGQPDLALACDQQDTIVGHLLEVFANVQLHAGTNDPMFACGQYYPKTQQLKFSLVDVGGGYLQPIQAYTTRPHYPGQPVTTSREAIDWALADSNTTKRTTTGGTGLKRLREYCERTGGELHIVSDGIYYSLTVNAQGVGQVRITEVPVFVGSAVHLIFNCQPALV